MNGIQSQDGIFDRLLLLVIFTILGAILGFCVSMGVSSLSSRGAFSFWKPIASENIVPEKILYANSNMVWVETDQGEMYFHQINCLVLSKECKTWQPEKNRNRFDNYEKPPQGNEGCAVHVFIRPKSPPRNSVQCVYANRVHTLNDGFTYYAVSTDNKIWYWRTPNRSQKLLISPFFILIGSFTGFFFCHSLTARRKGRYKEVLGDLVYLFVSMFLFAIAGSITGIIAGIGILHFQNTGAFTTWQLLDSPIKFVHIVNANTRTIWAQSADEKLYSRNLYCPWEECDFWVQTNAIPEDALSPNEGVNIGKTCQFETGGVVEGNIRPKKQPGTTVECALARGAMYESSWIVYYALLDNGKIWVWQYTSDLFYYLYIPFISALVGALLGMITSIVAFIIQKRKKKQTQNIA